MDQLLECFLIREGGGMSLLFVGLFGCAGGGRRAGQCRRVVRNGRRGLVVALSSSGVDGNGTAGGLSGKVEVLNVSNVDGREEKYVTVRARHILLETEEMADACLEQIEEKPEAFEEIAKYVKSFHSPLSRRTERRHLLDKKCKQPVL